MTKQSSAKIPRYRNPAAPARRRVDARLSRMTLEEKAAQMVPMYVRDCVSSVTRPMKELKGFQKISLQPGELEIVVGNSPRDRDLQKPILMLTR